MTGMMFGANLSDIEPSKAFSQSAIKSLNTDSGQCSECHSKNPQGDPMLSRGILCKSQQ
jgi:hypothetical protein